MKRPTYEVSLTAPADRDFAEIMDWSTAEFGILASDRYEMLIGQTLIDIGEDPFRPGARQRPELPHGLYVYHLANSRDRIARDLRVKAPRHFLLYQIGSDRVKIVRILHDGRDLAKHIAMK
jgi:toxin ParE1/3/4